jgi:hypothetical protein
VVGEFVGIGLEIHQFVQMLTGIPTPQNAGLGLYGDYNDLECLHETIHYLCDNPNIDAHQGEFALGLAFEVRKSFEGARETRVFGTDRDRVKYFGANNLWPYFLVQVGLLRSFAKAKPTSGIHHAQLYLLEHVTEKVLAEKDPGTAQFCREWLNHFPGLTRDYVTLFFNEETWKFVYEIPPKKRLSSLPGILRSFQWFSDEYLSFEKKVRAEAKKQSCSTHDLTLKREWRDFKW